MSDDPIWSQLLLQAALILLNAFFAASEIAVISLNEKKVRKLAEEGDKKSQKMLRMVESPTRFLSTIQVGITLAGFLGSAFAADNFAGKLSSWLVNDVGVRALSAGAINTVSVVIVTLILSFFTLVFGELVPKRIAMKKSEAVADMASGVIRVLSVVMKPIIWLLSASTNGTLRLFGINPKDEEEGVTEEEIRMMVDIGEEKGAIESGEREMIENVFEFSDLTAYDVMTHRTDMIAFQAEAEEEEVLSTITSSGLPVFPSMKRIRTTLSAFYRPEGICLIGEESIPFPFVRCSLPHTLYRKRCARTNCSRVCSKRRFTWRWCLTSTAAPRVS